MVSPYTKFLVGESGKPSIGANPYRFSITQDGPSVKHFTSQAISNFTLILPAAPFQILLAVFLVPFQLCLQILQGIELLLRALKV